MKEKIFIKLDLREIPTFERHPKIFETWGDIKVGETLQIINDHDPRPLHYQFEGEYQGSYEWEYSEKGPDRWVVNISKTAEAKSAAQILTGKVSDALSKIKPYLQADGGDVELVDVDDISKVVKVRLVGACSGCPSAAMTLQAGVEKTIREHVPEITRVVAV